MRNSKISLILVLITVLALSSISFASDNDPSPKSYINPQPIEMIESSDTLSK